MDRSWGEMQVKGLFVELGNNIVNYFCFYGNNVEKNNKKFFF